MVWNEYLNEPFEQVPLEDAEIPPDEPLEFDDWVDWYEPHLSNMWRSITFYRNDACINKHVGNYSDFWDFAQFMYSMSHKYAKPIT